MPQFSHVIWISLTLGVLWRIFFSFPTRMPHYPGFKGNH